MSEDPMVVLGRPAACALAGCPQGPEPHVYSVACDVAARQADPPEPIVESEVDRLRREVAALTAQKWLATSAVAYLWGRVSQGDRQNGREIPPPRDVATVLAWAQIQPRSP